MPSNKLIQQVRRRDEFCWHCGTDQGLVPHHRKNRGAGGSKLLDRIDNLMMICSYWNGMIEADAEAANTAREQGHKLRQWEDLTKPVFDFSSGTWYRLSKDGTKEQTGEDSSLF